MLNRITYLLIRLARIEEVVHEKHYAHDVAQELGLDRLGGREACVDGGRDPCCAVEVGGVEVREWFWCCKGSSRVRIDLELSLEGREGNGAYILIRGLYRRS